MLTEKLGNVLKKVPQQDKNIWKSKCGLNKKYFNCKIVVSGT